MTETNKSVTIDEWLEQHKEELSRQFKESNHPFEDGALDFLKHIEQCARISLLPPGSNCLPIEEVEALRFSEERIRPAFIELVKCFIEPLRDAQPTLVEHGFDQIWKLLGAAFRIGTHATVTQGAKNFFMPQIERELGQRRAKGGGRKSGEARKAKAETTWKPHALDLAIQSRKANPTLSQEDLADAIFKKWGPDVQKIGRRSLIVFLSKKEQSGELQARKVWVNPA